VVAAVMAAAVEGGGDSVSSKWTEEHQLPGPCTITRTAWAALRDMPQ
jgi:hypothetical protein